MKTPEARNATAPGCTPEADDSKRASQTQAKDSQTSAQESIKPPLERGDHVSVAHRLIDEDAALTGEDPVSDEAGSYHTWDGLELVWVPQADQALRNRVYALAGTDVLGAEGNTYPLRVRGTDAKAITGVLTDLTTRPGFFRDDVIAFENGLVLHVEGSELLQSQSEPEQGVRAKLPVAWDDEWAMPDHSLLSHYLRTSWDDEADRLRAIEVLGVALMGLGPRFKKAWMLCDDPDTVGSRGGTGKSVFLELLSALVPEERQCSVSPQMLADPRLYHVARLAGCTLNLVRDMDDSDIMRDDAFKAIVHGERTPARQPAGRTFEFTPMALHVFAANTLPSVPGASGAFWDRWSILKWGKRVRGTVQEIPHLANRIVDEEFSDLVHLAVKGASRVLAQGRYTTSASEAAELARWRVEADPLSGFLAECTTEGGESGGRELFEAWRDWCSAKGHQAGSQTKFGKRLRGLVDCRRSNGSKYAVTLKPDWRASFSSWSSL